MLSMYNSSSILLFHVQTVCESPDLNMDFCQFDKFQGFRFFTRLVGEVTHGAKNGGSFSEMMGPSISNQTQLTFG